ncbi:MAG: DUF2169 domain-containing protein [Polyangiaceae bacterium]
MELVNDTPLPSALVPTTSGDGEILMLVLSAITLDLRGSGPVLADAQDPLRIASDPVFPNDAQLLREGVAVCATGHLYPSTPGGSEGRAVLGIGDLKREVLGFGPRVWAEGTLGSAPSATSPRPFDRVPMRWENAFGGSAEEPARMIEKDGERYLAPAFQRHEGNNPLGKGYYATAKAAVDQPLPQLEHPTDRITSWEDRPEPVCFAPYPLFGALRAAFLKDGKNIQLDRLPRITGKSAPRTTFGVIPPGTEIALGGMRPGGRRITFRTPVAPVSIHVLVGSVEKTVTPALDAIDIDADAERVRLLFRAGFRYPLVAGELRRATIAASESFPPAQRG